MLLAVFWRTPRFPAPELLVGTMVIDGHEPVLGGRRLTVVDFADQQGAPVDVPAAAELGRYDSRTERADFKIIRSGKVVMHVMISVVGAFAVGPSLCR